MIMSSFLYINWIINKLLKIVVHYFLDIVSRSEDDVLFFPLIDAYDSSDPSDIIIT